MTASLPSPKPPPLESSVGREIATVAIMLRFNRKLLVATNMYYQARNWPLIAKSIQEYFGII